MTIPIPDCASFRKISRNSCCAERSSATDGSSRTKARGSWTSARAISIRRASPDDISSVNLRSEEHTSELQSQSNLVCRLLLEKKKKQEQKPEHIKSNQVN